MAKLEFGIRGRDRELHADQYTFCTYSCHVDSESSRGQKTRWLYGRLQELEFHRPLFDDEFEEMAVVSRPKTDGGGILKQPLAEGAGKSKAALQLGKSLFQPERLFLHRIRPLPAGRGNHPILIVKASADSA